MLAKYAMRHCGCALANDEHADDCAAYVWRINLDVFTTREWRLARVAYIFNQSHFKGEPLNNVISLTILKGIEHGYIRQSSARVENQPLLIPPHPAGFW